MAIDYQKVISDAFLNAVRHILSDTADNGLEPPTHFYITFRTNKKDVDIPDFLKQRYPDEMTIVLQHQFENLTVNDKAFSVDLSFNGQFWRLVVPFSALTAFCRSVGTVCITVSASSRYGNRCRNSSRTNGASH